MNGSIILILIISFPHDNLSNVMFVFLIIKIVIGLKLKSYPFEFELHKKLFLTNWT